MELDELARRVVRRHLLLLGVVTLVGLGSGAFAALDEGSGYVASATIAVTPERPTTEVEAEALVTWARETATSRTVVRSAVEAAGVSSDVDTLIGDIRVEAIGRSGLVRLELRHARASAAQRLADALATRLVKRLDSVTTAGIDDRVAALDAQEATLVASRRALGTAGSAAARDLDRALTALRAERVGLQAEAAVLPRAAVVDRPALPGSVEIFAMLRTVVTGGLLGLAAGLVLAALAEVARPGLTGLPSIAHALSVPSLGTPPGWFRGGDLSPVARRLRLLASARGADTVVLVPLRQAPDTAVLVSQLRAAVVEDTRESGTQTADVRPALELRRNDDGGMLLTTLRAPSAPARDPLRVCTLSELQPDMAAGAIAVLVTPHAVRRRELDDVLDLCAATGVMLAGVIGRPRTVAPLAAPG